MALHFNQISLLSSLLLAIVTMSTVDCASREKRVLTGGSNGVGSNVCYVQQNDGCKYRVTVLPTSCNHANDEGWINGIGERAEEDELTVDHQEPTSVKKLEALEQKLLKMMEDLSKRSLRHVREIRSDLRQMTNSMNSLKDKTTRSLVYNTGRSNPHQKIECPSEFIGMGVWHSCYRFSNFDASWHDAREYCNAFGSNLLSLDSMKEAYIIDYLIKSNPEFQDPKGWWTSGNYVVRSQRWMWSTGQQLQTMINFSRWAPGEPNARSTMHCMVLYKPEKYFWHDATCTDKHNFICEMEK